MIPKIFSLMTYLLLLLSIENTFAKEIIKFGIATNDDSNLYKGIDKIYSEAFSALGLAYKSIPCTPYHCSVLASETKIDGEAARHDKYSELYPKINRVDFILFKLTTIALTKKDIPAIHSLKDLKNNNYKIAYQIGYRSYEKTLSQLIKKENLTSVNHWREGLEKIKEDEIDVYIGIKQLIIPDITADESRSLNIHHINNYIINIHPYINDNLKTIEEPLRKQLLKMRNENRIKTILTEYGLPLYKPAQ